MDNNFMLQLGINLVVLGSFYGATIVEIRWIKRMLDKHDKKLDMICPNSHKQ